MYLNLTSELRICLAKMVNNIMPTHCFESLVSIFWGSGVVMSFKESK